MPKMRDKPVWESVWPCLDPWDSVRLELMDCGRDGPGMVPEMWDKVFGPDLDPRDSVRLECPREVWTARCALLFLSEKRADGPQ